MYDKREVLKDDGIEIHNWVHNTIKEKGTNLDIIVHTFDDYYSLIDGFYLDCLKVKKYSFSVIFS